MAFRRLRRALARAIAPDDYPELVTDPYVVSVSIDPRDTVTIAPAPRYWTGDASSDRYTVLPQPISQTHGIDVTHV